MKKNILGSISLVMIIMIFSRLLSLVSVQIYMAFYGASDPYLNIYSYAISVPNIIFTCFGTALSTVVIPIYAGYIANEKRDLAKSFANNLLTITFVFTAVLVLLGIVISPLLVKLTELSDYNFAVKALMIIMPVMLFYCLNYIFQGMLQSNGKYGWPASVSIPSSLVLIAYVFLMGDRFGITGLLIATLIGLSLQALILIPPLIKTGHRYSFSFNLHNEDLKKALKMTLPVLLGVSAYQINMFYNVTMIANYEGMVTLLTYVQNITLYMVLAFIYSITAVIYPKLTKSAATGNMAEYKDTLRSVCGTVIFLLVPITFGFIAVRLPLLELITKWGKITESDIAAAAGLLFMYSIGILGIGLKEVLDRAFYSLKETKVSAINGFIIMLVNIVLSLILMRYIGAYGIPLAYSIASLSGCIVLLYWLKRKIGSFGKGLMETFLKSLLSSIIMFGVVLYVNNTLSGMLLQDTLFVRVINLGVPFVVGVLVYFIVGFVVGIPEIKAMLHRKKTK